MANYLAAILIVAAVALFVAAPLSGGFPRRRGANSRELELERLEHERGLAVQGLRELAFDHEMGKLDELDYRDLKRSLEERALAAMSAVERLRGAPPMRPAARAARAALPAALPGCATAAPSAPPSRTPADAAPPIVNFCPQCGLRANPGHNFCAACGASLILGAQPAAARAE